MLVFTVVLPPLAAIVTVSQPTADSSGTSTVTDSVPSMLTRLKIGAGVLPKVTVTPAIWYGSGPKTLGVMMP
jgi:hypothetical protein